jgi:hypothetical protein
MVTLINNSTQKALTTLERAKIFMDLSGDSKDGLLTLLANQATGFIEQFLKRSLLNQVYTNEQYDGSGSDTIVLRNAPVTAFASLQVNTSGDSTADWQTIDANNYFWYDDGRVKLNNPIAGFLDADAGTFLSDPKKYRATYTAGFLIDFANENDPTKHTLPQEIEYACLKLMSAIFNSRKAEGLQSAKVGDISMTYRKAAFSDEDIMDILGKYEFVTI